MQGGSLWLALGIEAVNITTFHVLLWASLVRVLRRRLLHREKILHAELILLHNLPFGKVHHCPKQISAQLGSAHPALMLDSNNVPLMYIIYYYR